MNRQYSLNEGPFNDGTCFVTTTCFLSDDKIRLSVHDYGDGYDDWIELEGPFERREGDSQISVAVGGKLSRRGTYKEENKDVPLEGEMTVVFLDNDSRLKLSYPSDVKGQRKTVSLKK